MAGVDGKSFQPWRLLNRHQRLRQIKMAWKRGSSMRMLRLNLLLKVPKPEIPALVKII